MTLTEFLLARIAEDGAAAAECLRIDSDVSSLHGWVEMSGEDTDAAVALFSRFNPARVLAECEAKRQIVEQCRWALDEVRIDEYYCRCETANEHKAAMQALDLLRALGSVYADHPDYLEEWKP